jgi:hypothetical protein
MPTVSTSTSADKLLDTLRTHVELAQRNVGQIYSDT